jgi:hypothetical protein
LTRPTQLLLPRLPNPIIIPYHQPTHHTYKPAERTSKFPFARPLPNVRRIAGEKNSATIRTRREGRGTFIVRVGDDDEEFFCDAQGAGEEGFCRGEDEPGDEVGEGWGNEEEDEEETAVGFEEGEGLGCAGLEAAQAEQHCRRGGGGGGGGGGESGRNFK